MASWYMKIKVDGKWRMEPITHPNIDGFQVGRRCECTHCERKVKALYRRAAIAAGREEE